LQGQRSLGRPWALLDVGIMRRDSDALVVASDQMMLGDDLIL
jgi:hypothetical protein